MAGGTRQHQVLGALIAAGVLGVGTVAFVLGDDEGTAPVDAGGDTAPVTTTLDTVREGVTVDPPPLLPPGLSSGCGDGPSSSERVAALEGAVGSGGLGCEPLERLFRREAGPVVIRAYRTGEARRVSGCGPEGSCPPPECFPVGYVSAGLSSDEAVGLATGPLYERAPEPVVASHGFFGVGEGAPVAWAVVQVDPGVASVRARFDAGGDDEMHPQDGIAVLASSIRPDDRAPPEPGGTVETLDEHGDVIETADIAPGQGVEDRVFSSPECAPRPPGLPEPDGPPPADDAQARDGVIEGLTVAYAGASTPEERLSRIDDPEGLEGARQEVLVHFPLVPLDQVSVRVEEVRFLNPTTAAVRYTIVLPGYSIPEFPNRICQAMLVDDTWKVTRDTVCHDLALGGVTCPP
ncbi:MAG: hypothetical protein ACRDZ1_17565 [Acidimicrobiia bacterium]